MRKVTCHDCGKRYDFDKDEFCPRCGSFNPVKDSGSTKLEQELLERFDPAQLSAARPSDYAELEGKQPVRQTRPQPQPKPQPKPRPKPQPRPEIRVDSQPRQRKKSGSSSKNPVAKVIMIIVGIMILMNVVLPLIFGILSLIFL